MADSAASKIQESLKEEVLTLLRLEATAWHSLGTLRAWCTAGQSTTLRLLSAWLTAVERELICLHFAALWVAMSGKRQGFNGFNANYNFLFRSGPLLKRTFLPTLYFTFLLECCWWNARLITIWLLDCPCRSIMKTLTVQANLAKTLKIHGRYAGYDSKLGSIWKSIMRSFPKTEN